MSRVNSKNANRPAHIDSRTNEFVVKVRSQIPVGVESIKQLLQTKYEVLSVEKSAPEQDLIDLGDNEFAVVESGSL